MFGPMAGCAIMSYKTLSKEAKRVVWHYVTYKLVPFSGRPGKSRVSITLNYSRASELAE